MSRTAVGLGILAVFLTGVLGGVLLSKSDVGQRLSSRTSAHKIDEALSLIERSYIDPPPEDLLVDGAIRGMTQLLDPYSIYVDRRHLPAIREEIDGNFGGVGLWFEMVADTARVVSVIADGPGDRSGILPGDRIVEIDDSSAVGVSSIEVQNRIKGPKGTTVRLTLLRHAIGRRLSVSVERDIIPVNSVVASFLLDDSTAYIRLARFTSSTASEFRSAADDLFAMGAKRLLLDLRDNPGGLLDAAVGLADELLPSGLDIVSTEGRNGSHLTSFKSSDGGVAEGVPLIVLVNENSASASEIVAGAIQDNDRGLIVGQPTFGKGLVQSQYLFPDGSALHLTIARYHTPAGRPIQNNLTHHSQASAGHDSEQESDVDSLRDYTTVHGRVIKGGQGIYPDEILGRNGESGDKYFRFVLQSGLDIGFARKWFDKNEESFRARWGDVSDEFVRSFSPSEAVLREFGGYVREQAGEAFNRFSAADVAAGHRKLRTLLKGRLGQMLYGPSVWQSIMVNIDPDIQAANRFWKEAESLPRQDGVRAVGT